MCQEHSFSRRKFQIWNCTVARKMVAHTLRQRQENFLSSRPASSTKPGQWGCLKRKERLYYTIFVMVTCFRLLALNSETYTFAGWFQHQLSDFEKEEASLKFSEAVWEWPKRESPLPHGRVTSQRKSQVSKGLQFTTAGIKGVHFWHA